MLDLRLLRYCWDLYVVIIMTDKMTDNELTERYFKVRGLEVPLITIPFLVNGQPADVLAPTPILTDYPAFKEHVLEVMGEEGYRFDIHAYLSNQSGYHLEGLPTMRWVTKPEHGSVDWCERETVKDNNILHAAVIAATRYFEGKK